MQVTNPGAARMIALVGMHLGIDNLSRVTNRISPGPRAAIALASAFRSVTAPLIFSAKTFLRYRARPAERVRALRSLGAAACVGVEVHEDELQQIALFGH